MELKLEVITLGIYIYEYTFKAEGNEERLTVFVPVYDHWMHY